MKQPELGQKLLELRQYKGVTQQEVADQCNVSMRTIQRIELGQVEPRPMTIKLILEYLGEDYETFMGVNEKVIGSGRSWSGTYLMAAIVGVLYFILGLPEAYVDMEWLEGRPDKSLFVVVKLLVLGSYSVFMWGFVVLGRQLNVKILQLSAYGLIIATAGFYLTGIVLVFMDIDPLVLGIGESITMGTLSIFLGLALYKLRSHFGDMVVGAAVLEVLIGISFMFVVSFMIGLLLMIPAILIEIYLLYSASERRKTELQGRVEAA